MYKYLFILGQSSDLAKEELKAVLRAKNNDFRALNDNLILVNASQKPTDLINVLGGTIKIAEYIDELDDLDKLSSDYWFKVLEKYLDKEHKNNFGFSLYNEKKSYNKVRNTALELKKYLKEQGLSSRLVTAREPVLSSVIVAKNKLIDKELIIVKSDSTYILARTVAVQDFASYGYRDMKRPGRDDKSGMLPPKLAQMMINLSGADRDKTILDPFCGSGTVLQEAILLGYKNIHGSDISKKAIKDTEDNIKWLEDNYNLKANVNIFTSDVKKIAEHLKNNSIDIIVTEPFMGDARSILKIRKVAEANKIKNSLQNLYKEAFVNFKKVLSENGKIVFVFPIFNIESKDITTLDKNVISELGFDYILDKDLIYSRDKQRVKRQITVWRMK